MIRVTYKITISMPSASLFFGCAVLTVFLFH